MRLFFSFDGVDGVGKSTQFEQFCLWVEAQQREVVRCRDPGGTPLGEALRDLLLHRDDLPVEPRAEMLLYMASRAQLVSDVIRPALESGKVVVSDRFLLANVVYQGHAGGMPPDVVWQVGHVATCHTMPDQVFLLDMPARRAAARRDRELDRMEARGLDYLEQVRQGFLAEAASQPNRISVIDADASPHEVQQSIRQAALPLLQRPD